MSSFFKNYFYPYSKHPLFIRIFHIILFILKNYYVNQIVNTLTRGYSELLQRLKNQFCYQKILI